MKFEAVTGFIAAIGVVLLRVDLVNWVNGVVVLTLKAANPLGPFNDVPGCLLYACEDNLASLIIEAILIGAFVEPIGSLIGALKATLKDATFNLNISSYYLK